MGSLYQNRAGRTGPQILVRTDRIGEAADPNPEYKPKTGRKTKLAAFGLDPKTIMAGDPAYASCLDQANKFRKIRMKELAQLHGHVSAGAGALLASASLALAASRFLYQKAAESGDATLLKQASQLADSHRQSELAAYELASREGVLKKRSALADAGMPWLLNPDGLDKAKSGRKTNAERQLRDAEVPVPKMVESWEEPEG